MPKTGTSEWDKELERIRTTEPSAEEIEADIADDAEGDD